MARGKSATVKHEREADIKYGNVMITRFINKVMLDGKKTIAERIVYQALEEAAKKLNTTPVDVFEKALKNVSPSVQLKSRRVGGANLQVPTEVSDDRRIVLGLKWLVIAARNRKGKPMAIKLTQELMDAYNNAGDAIKKRDEVHRMAEANQAFAHFSRF